MSKRNKKLQLIFESEQMFCDGFLLVARKSTKGHHTKMRIPTKNLKSKEVLKNINVITSNPVAIRTRRTGRCRTEDRPCIYGMK